MGASAHCYSVPGVVWSTDCTDIDTHVGGAALNVLVGGCRLNEQTGQTKQSTEVNCASASMANFTHVLIGTYR